MEHRISVGYKGRWIVAEWFEVEGGYRGKYVIDDDPTDAVDFSPGPADWKVVDEAFGHPVAARANAIYVAREEVDSCD